MAGIYIHIPFCKQACSYCNFHFSTLTRHRTEMVKSIVMELQLRNYFFGDNNKINSIYFGGGTPSILPVEEIKTILTEIYSNFEVQENPEITLEANPDDLSQEYLLQLQNDTPINRLSIGVQSFFEEDLRYMHRAHNAQQAYSAIRNALNAGFKNLTVDLIYGTPTLSVEHWKLNIQTLLDFGIPHISAYALTVEEKTILYRHIHQRKKNAPDDDAAIMQYKTLIETLENAGFQHYEISNFAKENFKAVHNSSYWNNTPYLGIGPSAHSFDGRHRCWNVANNAQYIAALNENKLPFEKETLTENDLFNELLMIRLRTSNGVHLSDIKSKFSLKYIQHFIHHVQPFVDDALVRVNDDVYTFTTEGKLLSDNILTQLFYVD